MSGLTTVIALCGPAGSGKSTVADHLVEKYGAARYSFAMPLKEMVKRALDFTDEQVYGTQAQKEAVDPRYLHSARWFLQRIGTEGCRAVFGESFWTQMCLDMIEKDRPRLAVIEDCRFVNESRAVLESKMHGFVWRLWPVGDAKSAERAAAAGAHASEEEWKTLEANLEIRPKARGVPELLGMIDIAMGFVRDPCAGVRW